MQSAPGNASERPSTRPSRRRCRASAAEDTAELAALARAHALALGGSAPAHEDKPIRKSTIERGGRDERELEENPRRASAKSTERGRSITIVQPGNRRRRVRERVIGEPSSPRVSAIRPVPRRCRAARRRAGSAEPLSIERPSRSSTATPAPPRSSEPRVIANGRPTARPRGRPSAVRARRCVGTAITTTRLPSGAARDALAHVRLPGRDHVPEVRAVGQVGAPRGGPGDGRDPEDARRVDPAESRAEGAALARLEAAEVRSSSPPCRARRPAASWRSSAAPRARRRSRCRSRCRRARRARARSASAVRWPPVLIPGQAAGDGHEQEHREQHADRQLPAVGDAAARERILDLGRRAGLVPIVARCGSRAAPAAGSRHARGERRACEARDDGWIRCIEEQAAVSHASRRIPARPDASPGSAWQPPLGCGLAIPTEGARMKALVIVDMLDDFVTGALANPHAQRIVEPLARLLEHARGDEEWVVVFSNDAHDPSDPELRVWGEHALAGTPGAQVIAELEPQPGPGRDRLAEARLRRLRRHGPRRAAEGARRRRGRRDRSAHPHLRAPQLVRRADPRLSRDRPARRRVHVRGRRRGARRSTTS